MKIFGYISVIIFVFVISCSSNDKHEDKIAGEAETEEAVISDNEQQITDEDTEIDNNVQSDTNTYTGENRTPKISKIVIETVSNNIKDGFRAVITAEDPDGDNIDYIYQWKHNDEDIVGATEDTLLWSENFKKGDKITIEVIPFDDYAQGIWRSEGSFNIPNTPPSITSEPSGAVSNGIFTYNVEASDLDEDKLTFSLKDAPEGMKISESGQITWKYSGDDAGDYNIVIVVSDGDGGETYQELSITIEAQT